MLDAYKFLQKKQSGQKISMMTAYDLSFARALEAAKIDMILVGDSLANVVLGRKSTCDIGMDEMQLFVKAVSIGAPNTHIVADMPWQSDETVELALINAQKLVDAGATSVKIEGAKLKQIKAISDQICPVVGHLGLTPQTATNFKQKGNNAAEALLIKKEAQEVAQAGVFMIVLEHIPSDLGKEITQKSMAPTIGIGAGTDCDGQVLVCYDALGFNPNKLPPFVKKFSSLFDDTVSGVKNYINWVNDPNNFDQ